MLRVVLIDDEDYFRNSLKKGIAWEAQGFTIIGDANNGRDGLYLITEQQPDLAIIDINMPIMTGLDLVKQLRHLGVSCKCILLTGHDEFKYAQQAVGLGVSEYILKPVDFVLLVESLQNVRQQIEKEQAESSYLQTLEQKHTQLMQQNFLKDLLLCQFFVDETDQIDYLQQLNVHISFRDFTVSVLSFPVHLSHQALSALQQIFSEESPSHYALVEMSPTEVCIISESVSYDTLQSRLLSLNQLQLDVFTGISACHSDMTEVSLAYQEASLCLKHKLTAAEPIVQYEKISSTIQAISPSFRQQFKQHLQNRNQTALEQDIKGFYLELEKTHTNYDTLIVSTLDLICMLFDTLSHSSHNQRFSFQTTDSIVHLIDHAQSIDQLWQNVWNLFKEQLQSEQEDKLSAVTNKTEQYILLNYSNPDLSIDFLAKQLFLNYSYLCYCFKRDKKITINEFITQTRMQHAKQLFDEGHKNVCHVAEAVGYHDAGYFSKCFKKAVGVSPKYYTEPSLSG